MQKSHLIIDEGNTLCKFAIVRDREIIARGTSKNASDIALCSFAQQHSVSKIISLTTRGCSVELPTELAEIQHVRFSPQLNLPITLNYKTLETLGHDRIAAAAGASALYPNQNTLIIDIGTAITIDFLTAGGVFEGGIISPGPEMRAKAMNQFTGRLPLVEISNEANLQGKTTVEAMQFGITNGLRFEAEGYINKYQQLFRNINVIVTGGFADLLHGISCNARFEPDLVIIGMNRILEMNA